MSDLLAIPPEIDRPLAAATPMDIIADMVRRGAEPDQLAKLMDLQERYERNRAASAFADALAKFQSKCPQIHKGRRGDKANYASFDDIMHVIRPLLAECGLSISFDLDYIDEKRIDITTIVRHGIHENRTKSWCPVPANIIAKATGAGILNASQLNGSARSYAKRYAIVEALNIVVTDEDTDGNMPDNTPITREQAIQVNDCIEAKKVDQAAFLQWVTVLAKTEVAEVDQIPAAVFPKVWDMLKRKKG